MFYKRLAAVLAMCLAFPAVSFADYQAIVNVDSLNLRKEQNTTSTITGKVTANMRVDISGIEGKWLKTEFGNEESYLYHDYVDVYDVTCFGKATLKKDFVVKNSSLEFTKGESVPVYDFFNGYYLVKKQKQYLYVHSSLLNVKLTGVISRPVLLKNGVSTKHKNERLMNEKAVEHKISMAFTNQNKNSVFSERENDVNKIIAVGEQKVTDDIQELDLFDGYELDIEKVKSDALEKSTDIKEKNTDKNSNITTIKKEDTAEPKARLSEELQDEIGYFIDKSEILRYAVAELGKPYVYGATGPDTFDCSGFTSYVYKKVGISIPRTSAIQAENGEFVEKENLRSGDLVFFDTRSLSKLTVEVEDDDVEFQENTLDIVVDDIMQETLASAVSKAKKKTTVIRPNKVTHVGIYIGDDKFIHASSGGKEVVITDLNSKYYAQRYHSARRYK